MRPCRDAALQDLKSFWVPQQAPEARTVLDKPDMATLCPASGAKLKLKVWGELMVARVDWLCWVALGMARAACCVMLASRFPNVSSLPFTKLLLVRLHSTHGSPLLSQDLIAVKFTPVPDGGPHEHMDPVTKDTFTNASRLLVIKPTGALHGRCWLWPVPRWAACTRGRPPARGSCRSRHARLPARPSLHLTSRLSPLLVVSL